MREKYAVAVLVGAVVGTLAGLAWNARTPAQPDVRLVTFPHQNVECYVYRDDMVCLPYTDNGVEGARHDR